MHYAFPYRLALECLADGHGLGERRGAAVHLLDGFAELIGIVRHTGMIRNGDNIVTLPDEAIRRDRRPDEVDDSKMPSVGMAWRDMLDRIERRVHGASHSGSRELSMPLPDHVASRIRRHLDEAVTAELGVSASPLQDAVRPMLERALVRGIGIGVSLSATASGQGIEALKAGLADEFQISTPAPVVSRPATRPRFARTKSSKPRAAPGAVGQAIDLVLSDRPGLRIVDIQQMAVELDPSISRSSIVNELRRKLGTRYRQEGVRWFRIGDTEQASGLDRGNAIPELETARGEAAAAASTSPVAHRAT